MSNSWYNAKFESIELLMTWFHQFIILKVDIPIQSLNPSEARVFKIRPKKEHAHFFLISPNFGIGVTMSWNHWSLKRLRKSFGPIVWSSFLPDSHSGTYQCARSSVCARLRLACAWHYNVAKEFPSSRILHPLKKWCDYEFTTLNFWNVDFSPS